MSQRCVYANRRKCDVRKWAVLPFLRHTQTEITRQDACSESWTARLSDFRRTEAVTLPLRVSFFWLCVREWVTFKNYFLNCVSSGLNCEPFCDLRLVTGVFSFYTLTIQLGKSAFEVYGRSNWRMKQSSLPNDTLMRDKISSSDSRLKTICYRFLTFNAWPLRMKHVWTSYPCADSSRVTAHCKLLSFEILHSVR